MDTLKCGHLWLADTDLDPRWCPLIWELTVSNYHFLLLCHSTYQSPESNKSKDSLPADLLRTFSRGSLLVNKVQVDSCDGIWTKMQNIIKNREKVIFLFLLFPTCLIIFYMYIFLLVFCKNNLLYFFGSSWSF